MMKTRIGLLVVIAAVAGLFCPPSARAQVSTGQVYEIALAGTLVQSISIGESTDIVAKFGVTGAQIINIARGRSPGSPVPANEKLAIVLVFEDEGNPSGQLVVYDADGQSVLAVLANLDVSGAVDSSKGKGIIAIGGQVVPSGGFFDGWLAMTGKATVNNTSESQLVAFSANAVQGVFRGFDGENFFEVIVSKGKVKLLGQIGIVEIPNS